jgi:hypothetical protein
MRYSKRSIKKLRTVEVLSRRSNDFNNSNLKKEIIDSIVSIPDFEFEEIGFGSN